MKACLSEIRMGLDRAATSEEIRAAISFLPGYVLEEDAIASEMISDFDGYPQSNIEEPECLVLIEKLNDAVN